MKIKKMLGREILNSRGNPTVEVDVILTDGACGRAASSSGASTGAHGAWELRDQGKKRYNGKGVRKAVDSANLFIAPRLTGKQVEGQKKLDASLSVCRGERTAKYNQLLRIEEGLGARALYPGKKAFVRRR